MQPIYVGYYTIGTPYQDEAHELVKTLNAFGLPMDVRGVPNLGSWQANTQYKARFMAGVLDRYKCPVVYLDADARVIREPALFDTLGCDFAAHWLNGSEMLSGTLYFGPGEKSRRLCQEWIAECAVHPKKWDQQCLQACAGRSDARIEKLPAEYCWIDGGLKPDISETIYGQRDAVILQTQASRRLKRKWAI